MVDVALPAHARLLDVAIGDGPRFVPTRPLDLAKARDAYVESLGAMSIAAAEAPFEDEATLRIRTAFSSKYTNKIIYIEYSFTVLLDMHDSRGRLTFPAAAELSPPATRVEVHIVPGGGPSEISIAGASHPVGNAASLVAVDTVSTRNPWVVSFGPLRAPAERGVQGRLAAMTSMAVLPGRRSVLAYAIGASDVPRPTAAPERVLLLVDRSRSVGPGGMEGERDVARRILEAMPPSTRFDALFFDRAQKRLFPLARAATREAITAMEDEMVPARMANGTDLAGALRAAGDLLRREAGDFSPRCLLVLLTDGAVGAPPSGDTLPKLLGPLPGIELMVAAVSVRPNDDPPVSGPERSVLRALASAAPLGGVERVLRVAEIADGVPAFMEALRGGGDVYNISLGQGGDVVSEVLASGGGVSGILTFPTVVSSRGPPPQSLTYGGLQRPQPLRAISVDARWLAPLVTTSSPDARVLVSPGLSALVEPVVRPAAPARDANAGANPPGIMERSVVRDALSLAFTPRARACYLNRSAKTAAERDLTGRVRLALDLVRGEVADVRVEGSTLAHAAIETCLREAAFAIEVPRAYRNDDAITAVLNLVFRPRTPERRATGSDNPALNREIDLLVDAALKDSIATPDRAATQSPGSAPTPEPEHTTPSTDALHSDTGMGRGTGTDAGVP